MRAVGDGDVLWFLLSVSLIVSGAPCPQLPRSMLIGDSEVKCRVAAATPPEPRKRSLSVDQPGSQNAGTT